MESLILKVLKQSVKLDERGIDRQKKFKGRKRHIVVDYLYRLLQIKLRAANESDTKSVCHILKDIASKHPTIKAFLADPAYKGTAVDFVKDTLNLELHIAEKISDGFSVLPKGWILERTKAMLGNISKTI